MTRAQGYISFETVRAATDLVSLLAECGVVVSRSRMAHCPFHDDRRPSLQVKGRRWRCFGCGEHGDAFDWCERYFKMTTADALRFLAERAGIGIVGAARAAPPPSPERIEERKRKELRDRFFAWVAVEKGRNAERIRRLDNAIDRVVAAPDDLGTETAKFLYDRRARLEGLDEALWSRDCAELADYYRERMVYGYR